MGALNALPTVLEEFHFSGCRWGEYTGKHSLPCRAEKTKDFLDDAPEHIVKTSWKRLVYDGDGRIQRAGYSLCFLERL